jgi:acetyl esterase
MNQVSAVLSKTLRLVAQAFLATLGIATLVSFLPPVPGLGLLGSVVLGPLGPSAPILALAGSVWMFRLWRNKRTKRALVIASLAAFATVGSAFILYRQVAVARSNGIDVSLAQALAASSQKGDGQQPVTISYASQYGNQLPLDIYQPTVRPGGGLAPVFVYVHGGGWGSQTLKQRQADYRWFAERGYLVISIEYTLSSETRHTWNIAEPQLGCALAWVGANAARFGGDVSRLALWGESAGGNLILNIAYQAQQGTLKPSCPGVVPNIVAVLALYPVIDPALMYHNPDPLLGIFGRMMGNNYTGGSPGKFPDRYTAIASSTHINAKAPPTLLIIPEADHLVDPKAAYAFEAKAKAAGVKTRLIKVPYAEHSFDLRSGGIGNQLVRQAMLQFLSQNGVKP